MPRMTEIPMDPHTLAEWLDEMADYDRIEFTPDYPPMRAARVTQEYRTEIAPGVTIVRTRQVITTTNNTNNKEK